MESINHPMWTVLPPFSVFCLAHRDGADSGFRSVRGLPTRLPEGEARRESIARGESTARGENTEEN